jgi:hypothetical protein
MSCVSALEITEYGEPVTSLTWKWEFLESSVWELGVRSRLQSRKKCDDGLAEGQMRAVVGQARVRVQVK